MEHELLAMWFSVAAALVSCEAGFSNAPSIAGKKSTSLFTDKHIQTRSPLAANGTVWSALAAQAGWNVSRHLGSWARAQAGSPAHKPTVHRSQGQIGPER